MSNFKMIERLGLDPRKDNRYESSYFVDAEDLENLLQSAQVVYGLEGHWTTTQCEYDKFTGLLIDITPIKKKTKAEAALELLERLAKDPAYYSGLGTSAARAILEMKDEV